MKLLNDNEKGLGNSKSSLKKLKCGILQFIRKVFAVIALASMSIKERCQNAGLERIISA